MVAYSAGGTLIIMNIMTNITYVVLCSLELVHRLSGETQDPNQTTHEEIAVEVGSEVDALID